VMKFLGQVNVFQGRVRDGKAILGDLAFDFPRYTAGSERKATVYMRPHELDIKRSANGEASLKAKVIRTNPAGSVAKVHLLASSGDEIQVELNQDRFHELSLQANEDVHVFPKALRVFMPDYEI